jgi:hypothetical protein
LRTVRSVFSVEKKLSIAALSQQLPDQLTEQVSPGSASRWNCSLVYAAVRVTQQSIGIAPSPNRHHERIGNDLLGHGRTHQPPDNAPGEDIDEAAFALLVDTLRHRSSSPMWRGVRG